MWHSRPPRDPPPFMANAILNFHFDFLTPSLSSTAQGADRTQGGLFDVEIVSLGAAQCSDLPLCAYRSYIKIYPDGVYTP